MKIFDAAYLRLTGWYVLIIMTISILFSVWVYNQARDELKFGLTNAPLIVEDNRSGHGRQDFAVIVNDRLEDSRRRLIVRLSFLNLGVFLVGAAGSYLLARRTMQPVEEAVEAQHRFTADASHELRTPLAAMKTEIEVGLRDQTLSKSEAVELLKSNLEEINRLGMLTEGLLALSQSDDTPPAVVPVSLEDVTAKVAKRLQPLAEAKHIKIERDLQPVIVLANEDAVDKIVGILLDNAIKYSLEKTTVHVSVHGKDDHGYVTITDQGIGIKATELPHIFDRFYRADSSRSKAHVAGHGLGLSIAQTLAESLDGHITAKSTQDKGSTFTLKLPAQTGQ